MSLWDDAEIQKTMTIMDPKVRYEYAKIGQELFRPGGLYDSINSTGDTGDSTRQECNMYEAATQVTLMLRDGLNPSELTTAERDLIITVFGEDALNKYIEEY